MSLKRALVPVFICALFLSACDYIVTPEPEEVSAESRGWSALVTNVGTSAAGDLHVDLAIRNDTADWSAMQAMPGRPAVLTTSDGRATNCATVFLGTGGHRLAPGFQMRGYIVGVKAEAHPQLLYVECEGATAARGSKLSLDYTYYAGEYNYYDPEAHKTNAKLEVKLDDVAKDLKYPIATPVDGLIQKPGASITAINDCALKLAGVQRTAQGLQFQWQTSNPGEYPTYVHIGNPPVIGADGLIYGAYESPHLASAPITGAGKTAEWSTEVAVPQDLKGLYLLLSVESKQQRLFLYYAVDLTGQ